MVERERDERDVERSLIVPKGRAGVSANLWKARVKKWAKEG